MKPFLLCLGAVAIITGLACRQHDPMRAMVDVPALRGDACATLVLRALHRQPGIDRDSIEVDLTRRRVTLTYDSMILSLKNIEHAIADAGFQANDISPDPAVQATLPPVCGGSASTATADDVNGQNEMDAQDADLDESVD